MDNQTQRIFVTGAKGQLGIEIQQLAHNYPHYEFLFTDIDELDICNILQIDKHFTAFQPHVVINCSAYNFVDKAESEPEKALETNAYAVNKLRRICQEHKALLIHFSTDFVFDGKKTTPYKEDDSTHGLSAYARSKEQGEKFLIRKNSGKNVIIRTSWLYSAYGHNFTKTILRLLNEKSEFGVVFDQVGTPTWAHDLAETVLNLIPRWREINDCLILHYSNEGVASWYDFACEIQRITQSKSHIKPILTSDYPLPAIRPAYSVLDKSKIKCNFGIEIPHWRVSLEKCLKQIIHEPAG